jgi:hypothetical protein
MEGFRTYAVQMGPAAMIHIPILIKISSGIQKLTGGFMDTQTPWRTLKPTLEK